MKPTVRWRRVWLADYQEFHWRGIWRGVNGWEDIRFAEDLRPFASEVEAHLLARIARRHSEAA